VFEAETQSYRDALGTACFTVQYVRYSPVDTTKAIRRTVGLLVHSTTQSRRHYRPGGQIAPNHAIPESRAHWHRRVADYISLPVHRRPLLDLDLLRLSRWEAMVLPALGAAVETC
jgi:hypothetical protein